MKATSIYDEKNHTLLVQLPINYMFDRQQQAREMGFKGKEEFHITVIGYTAGTVISSELKNKGKVVKDLFLKAVTEYQSAVLNADYSIPTDCEMRIIEKQYSNCDPRKSLIVMLETDEHTLRLHHKLDALFPGIIHHLSIPHVTIGVDGDHPGIGLTPVVMDNELTSNFLVASPTELNRYKSQVESLQRENESLEYTLHNQPPCSCHHCEHCDEWNECTGGCHY